MLIKKANPEDLGAFLKLREHSVMMLAGTHYSREQLEAWVRNIDVSVISSLFSTDRFFIGESEDQEITCGGSWQGQEIIYFYVSPKFSRQGWGTALLKRIEQDYTEQAGHPFILAEASNNARPFYRVNGYDFVSLEKGNDEGRVPYTYSVMKKAL